MGRVDEALTLHRKEEMLRFEAEGYLSHSRQCLLERFAGFPFAMKGKDAIGHGAACDCEEVIETKITKKRRNPRLV